MNQLSNTYRLLFVLLLHLVSTLVYAAGDIPITPLTQVNKEFLVVVHIVKDNSKTPVIAESIVLNAFADLNAIFKPIAVSFKVCEFRYIDNFQYDTIDDHHLDEVLKTYNVASRINVYYSAVVKKDNKVQCGFAALEGINVNPAQLSSINIGCTDIGTLAHEFGHFFSLLHTFEGSGAELADGSNCSTTGDLVCDTPADPYDEKKGVIGYLGPIGCTFISKQKDANGSYYDPDVGNIMSYYGACTCTRFTNGQYEKMANYYLSHPLAW